MYLNSILKHRAAIIIFLLSVQIKEIYSNGKIYTASNSKKYYIEIDEKYSWFDALSECLKMNMILASMDTVSKTNEINSLVLKTFGTPKYLWLGGIASHYPNRYRFKWIGTGSDFSYTLWDAGDPNFADRNQYCISIGWDSNMSWSDISCINKYGFICEEDPRSANEIKLQQELKRQTDLAEHFKQQLQQVKENLQTEIKEKSILQEKYMKCTLVHEMKMQQECLELVEKQITNNKIEKSKKESKEYGQKIYNTYLQFYQNK